MKEVHVKAPHSLITTRKEIIIIKKNFAVPSKVLQGFLKTSRKA
jgi:hypothetical protein